MSTRRSPSPAGRRRAIRVVAGVLLALPLLAGCARPVAVAPAQDATPAMWRIADDDTTIYLLGTIHLLPPDVQWQHDDIARAARRSETLVLEVADITDATKQASAFLAIARAPGAPPPLADRIAPELRPVLLRRIEAGGAAMRGIDAMKSWAAAVLIGATQWRTLGASQAAGVDSVLAGQFRAANKPVIGLESGDAQFRLFDALSEDAQRQLLEQSLRDGEDPGAAYREMLDAWRRGDIATIAALGDRDLGAMLKGPLLIDRNARWADWIADRMMQPGVVMVAVGAAHLAGPGSVQAQLADRGYLARRL